MNLYLVRHIIHAIPVPSAIVGVAPIFKTKKKANEYARLCGAKVEIIKPVKKLSQ
jgi:hypothetical protein